jgi:hypothetical protein
MTVGGALALTPTGVGQAVGVPMFLVGVPFGLTGFAGSIIYAHLCQ